MRWRIRLETCLKLRYTSKLHQRGSRILLKQQWIIGNLILCPLGDYFNLMLSIEEKTSHVITCQSCACTLMRSRWVHTKSVLQECNYMQLSPLQSCRVVWKLGTPFRPIIPWWKNNLVTKPHFHIKTAMCSRGESPCKLVHRIPIMDCDQWSSAIHLVEHVTPINQQGFGALLMLRQTLLKSHIVGVVDIPINIHYNHDLPKQWS